MATKRMLIDATHPEETRVVVVSGNRLEDFDVEVASRKQLKGNIYLAKVTRVEPSLQAAFVEYGGNRHGFLAFSEIHPDYYQIPVADREALMAEDPEEEAENGDDGAGEPAEGAPEGESLEILGGDDPAEEAEARRPYKSYRNYKIQEVIKRRQILLIQVVKEERGNKGAALTTYLSLAGRYCVLMPNTTRAGGISRKISSAGDRKRLKSILGDMEIPDGMAVIVRTAGAQRSKAEIRRDYDYLIRQWDSIRKATLESTAPCLIYEEGDLIKRSIRDLYDKDIDEVVVEGDDGYKTAKAFMKMLIPSHAKKVQPYKDNVVPLFHRYQVESQLDAMHSPGVQLKSGGYIVINPTEALVSIDVNSGKATRERNIEETAYRTNLEAADEIARQLRLRDLAGLIVVDFIDMEVNRYQTNVERRIKEAMRSDRARIQIGRISPFGLLELSRQRLRPSLIETSFSACPHCGGTGVIRSIESTALHVLRAIEEEGLRRRSAEITVHVATRVALYILNQKRKALADIEERYEVGVLLHGDDSLIPPDLRIERLRQKTDEEVAAAKAKIGDVEMIDLAEDDEEAAEDGGKRKKRRRRRRKKPDGAETDTAEASETEDGGEPDEADESPDAGEAAANGDGEADEDDEPRKRRRRGKRGGRRRGRRAENGGDSPTDETGIDETGTDETDAEDAPSEPDAEQPPVTAENGEADPDPGASPPEAVIEAAETQEDAPDPDVEEPVAETADPDPTNDTEAPEAVAESEGDDAPADPAPIETVESAAAEEMSEDPYVPPGTEVINVDGAQVDKPRKGWWSRLVD